MVPETTGGSSSKSSTDPSARLRIGIVGKPHGIRGHFNVNDATERTQLLDVGASVRVGSLDTVVKDRRGTADHPLVAVEGVEDREAAERLRGAEVTVARSQIGELPEGEYLTDELVGLRVVDGDRVVGVVTTVLLLPSADVLEVRREGQAALLVPMVRDALRGIDIERGVVDVKLDFLGEAEHAD